MENYQTRPTWSQPFPKANATFTSGHDNGHGGRHENARIRGQRRGSGRQYGQGREGHNIQLGLRNDAKITKGKG